MTGENYYIEDYMGGDNSPMRVERVDYLQEQLLYLSQALEVITTEIEMTLGMADLVEEIRETVAAVKMHAIDLKENWWAENQK